MVSVKHGTVCSALEACVSHTFVVLLITNQAGYILFFCCFLYIFSLYLMQMLVSIGYAARSCCNSYGTNRQFKVTSCLKMSVVMREKGKESISN